MDILYFALIGLAAGWLAGQLTKGSDFGLLGNLVVGAIGALVGGFLFRVVGLAAIGLVADILMATVGAVAFLFLLGWMKRKKML